MRYTGMKNYFYKNSFFIINGDIQVLKISVIKIFFPSYKCKKMSINNSTSMLT